MTAAGGLAVVQLELRVAEVGPAAAFLRAAFGWTVSEAEPGLAWADPGALPVVRVRAVAPGEAPGVTPWVATEDLAAGLAAAAALGAGVGEVIGGAGAGWAAETRDPWGHALCLWQPDGAFAPALRGEGSHRVAWVEAAVPGLAAAVRHYRQLCGWGFQMSAAVEGFAYSVEPGRDVGVGLAAAGREASAQGFGAFVGTADLDLAAARIGLAGGHMGRGTQRGPRGERRRGVTGPGGVLVGLVEIART